MAIKSANPMTFNAKYTGSAVLTGGEILKWTAAGTVDISTAVADKVAGVSLHATTAGNVTAQNVGIASAQPIVECIVGVGGVTALDFVVTSAAGRIIVAVANATGVTPFEFFFGIALATGIAGEVVPVQMFNSPHSIT